MKPTTRRRLFLVVALLLAFGALGFVATSNMGENLVYYWDPTQLRDAGDKAVGATIRLGGMVQKGTVDWQPDSQSLRFTVTDGKNTVDVVATGAPPQMFREGIGVVVEGTMTPEGVFKSDRLMVKHSNEYKPPKEGVSVEDMYKTMLEDQ